MYISLTWGNSMYLKMGMLVKFLQPISSQTKSQAKYLDIECEREWSIGWVIITSTDAGQKHCEHSSSVKYDNISSVQPLMNI